MEIFGLIWNVRNYPWIEGILPEGPGTLRRVQQTLSQEVLDVFKKIVIWILFTYAFHYKVDYPSKSETILTNYQKFKSEKVSNLNRARENDKRRNKLIAMTFFLN